MSKPYRKARFVKPIGDLILIKRKYFGRSDILYTPEQTVQKNIYGIVISVGKNVKHIKKNHVVLINGSGIIKTLEDDGVYHILKESDVLLVYVNNFYRPIGRRVLIKRETEEQALESGIIIPACFKTRDQSLFGIVMSEGVINGKALNIEKELGIRIGQRVRLEKWDISHLEIEINREYYLSVLLKNILYAEDN